MHKVNQKGGESMEEIKKGNDLQTQLNEEYFMQALFDTYRDQYGECTITEVTEDKTA